MSNAKRYRNALQKRFDMLCKIGLICFAIFLQMHCQKGLEMLYKKGFICFAKKVSYALQKRFHMLRKKRYINALPHHIFHICLSSAPFSFFSSSCLTFAHIFRHLQPSHYINRLHPAITNSSATSNKAIMRSTHCVILFYVTVVLQ